MIRGFRVLGASLGSLILVGTLAAQGWDGDQAPLPVPPTAVSRQSELSLGLIAKTPVERLKAASLKDPVGTVVSTREVRKGKGADQLWEIRWEPGQPWGAGTWVAFRDGLGRIREVRVILLEGSEAVDHRLAQAGTWIRLVPQARGSRLDLFLAGRLVSGGWTVPADLVTLLGSPDSWLWDATAEHLDWGSLLPQRRWEDEKVESLGTRIHKLLSTVPAAQGTLWWPDPRSSQEGASASGAPWGSWSLLPGQEGETSRGMGPWGVTLWVSTGVLRGWKGGFPTWEALLQPRIALPGYSRALGSENLTSDPAFALDWIRNLGLSVEAVVHPDRPRTDGSSDVQGLPFLEPVPGAGYLVDDVPALFHLLAVTRPGQAYLGSLSLQSMGTKGAPSSVAFREPAVILPWVGKDARVRVVVYAGPEELSWSQWLSRFPKASKGVRPDHLALTSLPLPPKVELPLLPAR